MDKRKTNTRRRRRRKKIIKLNVVKIPKRDCDVKGSKKDLEKYKEKYLMVFETFGFSAPSDLSMHLALGSDDCAQGNVN